jgi:hypothetical protein
MEGWKMLVAMMMLLVAPNPHSLDAPRKAYAACVKEFETKSLAAKLDPAAYSAALKGACTAEAAALAKALVDFDVGTGTKRAAAAATADSDVADYRLTSEERFRDMMAPPKPQ